MRLKRQQTKEKINITIDKDLFKFLKKTARETKSTFSYVINLILVDWKEVQEQETEDQS